MDFQPKSESALDRLTDDEIIDYISNARDAAEIAAFRIAVGVLAYRREPMVRAKIQLKVDSDQDIEDLVTIVLTDTIKTGFEGTHMGEFVNLLQTITRRRIADFYSKNRLETEEYIETGEDEGNPATPVSSPSTDGVVAIEQLIADDLAGLSESHRLVIDFYLKGHQADEVADLVNEQIETGNSRMTPANVHQITKRFRDRMAEHLKESD
ncbi:MAG: hypothetical protein WBW44_09030 [Solirubrobacterales bacterium]